MKRLAFSSEFYFIKALDLKGLEVDDVQESRLFLEDDCVYLMLHHNGEVHLYHNACLVKKYSDDEFVKTRVIYYTYPAFIGFLLTLIKPIKRRFYFSSNQPFTVRLEDILEARLPRGERNETNAYQFNNPRIHMDYEKAMECYHKLKDSLKEHGYDKKYPMFVMLNRKFGVRDQLLQGHHRIGICKELGIKEISIAFWAAPASFSCLRKFIVNKN